MEQIPPLHGLRHLIVKTMHMEMVCNQLQGLPFLETLKLQQRSGVFTTPLDVSRLHALKNLCLENMVPSNLSIPEGCKLHVSWNDESSGRISADDRTDWLTSTLWSRLPGSLVSVQVNTTTDLCDADMVALEELLGHAAPLEFLKLDLWDFGTDDAPILVSQGQWHGLLEAKMLSISAAQLRIFMTDESCAFWEYLTLDSEHLELVARGADNFLENVRELAIKCKSFYGSLGFEIAEKLSRSGRSWRVVPRGGVTATRGNYFTLTTVREDKRAFDKRMLCGCCACMSCLLGGKIHTVSSTQKFTLSSREVSTPRYRPQSVRMPAHWAIVNFASVPLT